MTFPKLRFLIAAVFIASMTLSYAAELPTPKEGDWVKFKIIKASEWVASPAEYMTISLGQKTIVAGMNAQWWQMTTEKKGGRKFVIQALSERAPMTTESGDTGIVFRYIFKQNNEAAIEYANKSTGLAFIPKFGFRDGLIPTPRSRMSPMGPFLGTGNYIGQAISAQESGSSGKWNDLDPRIKLMLDDDLLVGTARNVRDDGKGQGADREYTYVDYSDDDFNRAIESGFNIFIVNDKEYEKLRNREVFFVKNAFTPSDFPEILYRPNFWGMAMFTDEPAVRLDTTDCRTVYDAANLMRLRDFSYHIAPATIDRQWWPTQSDAIVRMINSDGFCTGDWLPLQKNVPVWETYYETAFYQLQGGAAGIVHEGRYQLNDFYVQLEKLLGTGVHVDTDCMYDLTYSFMRGAARCFDGEWGTAIYGQADYSIAPQAVNKAYDMGAYYLWFWTSDHDHHLPWAKQLEMAKIIRNYQAQHPRKSRLPKLRNAPVAVAIPNGYTCQGSAIWLNPKFRADKLNEFRVPYGDVVAEAYFQMYRLHEQGIDFDTIVDVPDVIESAGYDKIIRVGVDARTNLADPTMPASALDLSVTQTKSESEYKPKPQAPRVTAEYVRAGTMSIDGNLNEWSKAQWVYPRLEVAYDPAVAKRAGDKDLSARFALAYDDESVYVAVQVTDDVFKATKAGDLIWLNDSVQVAFDPLFNPHQVGTKDQVGAYALDDSEIGFSLVDGKPYVYRWEKTISGPPGEVQNVKCAIKREGDVTIYEARIPFSELWPLTPSFPGMCGVNVAINDADTDIRKGAIEWTHGIADGKSPSSFGVLKFKGSENLRNATPMAFAQPEKVVLQKGDNILFRLDTGSRTKTKGEIDVTIQHGNSEAPMSKASFEIPKGMKMYEVKLSTSGLESDSYKAILTLKIGDRIAVRQNFRVYVLP